LKRLAKAILSRHARISEAVTGADTPERALILAGDALATAVDHYLAIGRAVPSPKPRAELPLVALDPKIAARLLRTSDS
jgi:hypothetical protein